MFGFLNDPFGEFPFLANQVTINTAFMIFKISFCSKQLFLDPKRRNRHSQNLRTGMAKLAAAGGPAIILIHNRIAQMLIFF